MTASAAKSKHRLRGQFETDWSRSCPAQQMSAASVTGHSLACASKTAVSPRPGTRRLVASTNTATTQPCTTERWRERLQPLDSRIFQYRRCRANLLPEQGHNQCDVKHQHSPLHPLLDVARHHLSSQTLSQDVLKTPTRIARHLTVRLQMIAPRYRPGGASLLPPPHSPAPLPLQRHPVGLVLRGSDRAWICPPSG